MDSVNLQLTAFDFVHREKRLLLLNNISRICSKWLPIRHQTRALCCPSKLPQQGDLASQSLEQEHKVDDWLSWYDLMNGLPEKSLTAYTFLKWSSQGNDVHLIDAQQAQLEASLQAVEDFRSSWSDTDSKKGSILTHLPEELSKAVEDSWLVVEVRQLSFG